MNFLKWLTPELIQAILKQKQEEAAMSAFDMAVDRVFDHEAGYVDHPRDPGGATNMGITRRTLAQWRGIAVRDLPKSEVMNLSRDEARSIYKAKYWDSVRGDDLPAGLALAVFDFAVNSGPSRAVRFLQAIVGTKRDGIIGGMTLKAVSRMDESVIINQLQDNRLAFMKSLAHWDTFKNGWTRRVREVRSDALSLSGGGGGGGSW